MILAFNYFLEDAPLALGSNFGPLVEFWVRLPPFKIQVHVVIALGTPRGTITKTPLTFWRLHWGVEKALPNNEGKIITFRIIVPILGAISLKNQQHQSHIYAYIKKSLWTSAMSL